MFLQTTILIAIELERGSINCTPLLFSDVFDQNQDHLPVYILTIMHFVTLGYSK